MAGGAHGEWARSWTEKLQASGTDGVNENPENFVAAGSIFRVPEQVRKTDPSAYEPRVISIGPYHHDKPHLKAMEHVKFLYLKRLLRRNPTVASSEDYLQLISGLMSQARNCYSDEVTDMDERKFLDMLLLDGCFVVELLASAVGGGSGSDPVVLGDALTRSLVKNDLLFLVENQLPLCVIDSLYHLATATSNICPLVKLVIDLYFDCPPEISATLQTSSFYNLFHLTHSCVTNHWPSIRQHDEPDHPIQLAPNISTTTEMWMIPCVMDLIYLGLDIKRKKGGGNPYSMAFNSRVLEIEPGKWLDNSSNCFYRNLIAFEQHPICNVPTQITAFTMLMSCLVTSESDVEALRRHQINICTDQTPEEAKFFFRKLHRDVIVDPVGVYMLHLHGISSQIRKYDDNGFYHWRKRLRSTFSAASFWQVYGVVISGYFSAIQTFFSLK